MATMVQRWALVGAATVGLLVAGRPATVRAACTGDCDGSGSVTVDEIVILVTMATGVAPRPACAAGAPSRDGTVAIDDIITAVNNALLGSCAPVTQDLCGDGAVDPPEECDDGGSCVGGSTAGTHCMADAECGLDQPGMCVDGTKLGAACRVDTDCPGSSCVRCRVFGGDGCAANCTMETSITFRLVPGMTDGLRIQPGTSGAELFGDVFTHLPLPLEGMQTLTIGKERDGRIPGVIKAASVQFPPIPVSSIACACVRGVPMKTCGGTLFDEDGKLAGNCSDNVPNSVACPADRPCAFVHGPGNSAEGMIGCHGLDPIDVAMTQDCNATPGGAPGSPQLVLSGVGPAGSAFLLNTIQVGTPTGPCTPSFCTDADPVSVRGAATTLAYTTGTASATTLNISNLPGESLGPCTATGVPFNCPDLTGAQPSVSGARLATAFTSCDADTVGDICVTTNLVAE